jgi:hypothetical protein
MKILISHPGFSDFHNYFKNQSEHAIILHRNFDLNSTFFRICRFFRILNILEKRNTLRLVKIYNNYNVDKVVVIKGCTINYELLDKHDVHYVIYLWDSIKNIYNGGRYINISSLVLTFDLKDSLQYKFKYLPLFHFRSEHFDDNEHTKRSIISIYGSYSRERVRVLNNIICKQQVNVPLAYVITISFFTFFKEWILGGQDFLSLWKYTTFKELPRERIQELLTHSLATLDIANLNQSGMTTRTFEALSYSTKLITNNMTTYDFCLENNIPVLLHNYENGLDIKDLDLFLDKAMALDKEFFIKYSINNFLNNIINYKAS